MNPVLLLGLLVGVQEPVLPTFPDVDPAVEALAAISAKIHDGEALHFSLETDFSIELREGEGLEALSRSSVEARLLKPMLGWVRIQGEGNSPGDGDKIDVTFVGDGKNFWLLDHARKQRIKTGRGFKNLEMFLPHFLPLRFWLEGPSSDEKTPWPSGAVEFAPPNKAFEGLFGLELAEDKGWKTLWLDDEGALKAFTWRTDPEKGRPIRVAMTGLDLSHPDEISPEDYEVEIPEGYQLIDLEARKSDSMTASLLTVGSMVPSVGFTDISGRTLTMEDFQGKTVFLNFWFYH